jgi:serine/threonine protein kinase
LTERQA